VQESDSNLYFPPEAMLFCISTAKRQLCVATEVADMWNTVHPFQTHVITKKGTMQQWTPHKKECFNVIL
jgi:hypothetical protein